MTFKLLTYCQGREGCWQITQFLWNVFFTFTNVISGNNDLALLDSRKKIKPQKSPFLSLWKKSPFCEKRRTTFQSITSKTWRWQRTTRQGKNQVKSPKYFDMTTISPIIPNPVYLSSRKSQGFCEFQTRIMVYKQNFIYFSISSSFGPISIEYIIPFNYRV